MARIPLGWHPEDIKARLRATYGPITTLSETWGFGRNAITLTLKRHDYSQRVEKQISKALDVPLHELWPARWSPEGEPCPRSNTFDPIRVPPRPTSQNAGAA